jgi:DUF3024 family protein
MPIPELELARVRAELSRFAERVPPHARAQVHYEFKISGNKVTLLECRPGWRDPSITTEQPFARFVFDPAKIEWSLQCSDRNGRWHSYDGIAATRHFAELVAEVERDPTGIFLG